MYITEEPLGRVFLNIFSYTFYIVYVFIRAQKTRLLWAAKWPWVFSYVPAPYFAAMVFQYIVHDRPIPGISHESLMMIELYVSGLLRWIGRCSPWTERFSGDRDAADLGKEALQVLLVVNAFMSKKQFIKVLRNSPRRWRLLVLVSIVFNLLGN